MDLFETRRRRLQELVTEELGTQTRLSELIGRQTTYVSKLISGQKNLGERLARDIEQAVGKPHYWLDGNMDAARRQIEEFESIPAEERKLNQLEFLQQLREEAKRQLFIATVEEIDGYLRKRKIDWPAAARARSYFSAYRQAVEMNLTLAKARKVALSVVRSDVQREKRAAKTQTA